MNTLFKKSIVFCMALCIALQSPVLKAEEEKKYLIQEDDQLSIIVYPAEEMGRDVVVQPDGNIELKLIGSVQAKGITARSLAKLLELRLSAFVKKPQVSVIIKKFSGHQLFLTGAVKSTGSFKYRKGMKTMELISMAGGYTDEAALKKVRIFRGSGKDKKIIPVNLDKIMSKGLTEQDIILLPGDVVFIPQKALVRATWFLETINPWISVINLILLTSIAVNR